MKSRKPNSFEPGFLEKASKKIEVKKTMAKVSPTENPMSRRVSSTRDGHLRMTSVI